MEVSEILGIAKQLGPLGFIKMEPVELRNALAILAEHHQNEMVRFTSATSRYYETDAVTEWYLPIKNTSMRMVWIAKRVTRGNPEYNNVQVIETYVMLVDMDIASEMVDLLNSQEVRIV